jgi:hypothetical protein
LSNEVALMLESWSPAACSSTSEPSQSKLTAMLRAAVASLDRGSHDVEVSARFDAARLTAVAFDARVIRLIGEARGQIRLTAR